MNDGLYQAFGFALLFILSSKKRVKRQQPFSIFYLKLSFCLAALLTADFFLASLLWNPSGRGDLRLVSLFLGALVIAQGRDHFFFSLMGFSLWMLARGATPLWERVLIGLGFPLLTGVVEWLLQGLRDRLRLADVPMVLEGVPLLFWLATILTLVFQGMENAFRPFVN